MEGIYQGNSWYWVANEIIGNYCIHRTLPRTSNDRVQLSQSSQKNSQGTERKKYQHILWDTSWISNMKPKKVWKLIFLFNWVDFRFFETNSSPLKIGHPKKIQKETVVFQPSIFRCEPLVSGRVYKFSCVLVVPRFHRNPNHQANPESFSVRASEVLKRSSNSASGWKENQSLLFHHEESQIQVEGHFYGGIHVVTMVWLREGEDIRYNQQFLFDTSRSKQDWTT